MIKTTPIIDTWMYNLRIRGFTKDSIFDEGQHEDLKAKLLSFGGEAVVLPRIEEDKESLMERGILFDTMNTKFLRGRPSKCHTNVACNYFEYKEFTIATGYALSQDGVWRQHSWNMDGKHVVETTEPRVAYFGFILNQEEAEKFVSQNM